MEGSVVYAVHLQVATAPDEAVRVIDDDCRMAVADCR